jgi:hypothetical protein
MARRLGRARIDTGAGREHGPVRREHRLPGAALRSPENKLIIVDAGSGIKPLGDKLVREDLPHGPIRRSSSSATRTGTTSSASRSSPIFIPGTELEIYSPVNYEERSVEEIIGIQLSYQYFPVRQSELSATITYHSLKEQVLDLGDGMVITTKFLNHPVSTLGYRFDYDGRSIVTSIRPRAVPERLPADPEHPDYDAAPPRRAKVADEENARIRQFYAGADVVIHDSQYTQAEYDAEVRRLGPQLVRVGHQGGAQGARQAALLLPPRPASHRRSARRPAADLPPEGRREDADEHFGRP